MKRIIIVGLFLLAISLAVAPFTSAETYSSTERATLDVDSMTLDFNETTTIQGSVEGTSWTDNTTMPVILDEFNKTTTKYAMYANGNNITYNLTINGVAVETNTTVADGSWDNNTLTNIISAGVDVNDTYINAAISVNNSNWTAKAIWIADDADVRAAWISSEVVITETDNVTPSIDGVWKVTDNLTFDLEFDITDVDIYIDYPSNIVSESPTLWDNDSSLSDGDSVLISYQKYGALAELDEDDITATAGQVIIEFKSKDELDDATWEIDFDDDAWNGAFDDLDAATLEIEVNGKSVDEDDWEIGSLTIEKIDLRDGDNDIVFTWTVPAVVAPVAVIPVEAPVLEQEYIAGIPNWVSLAIVAVIVIAVIAVYTIEKK